MENNNNKKTLKKKKKLFEALHHVGRDVNRFETMVGKTKHAHKQEWRKVIWSSVAVVYSNLEKEQGYVYK